MATLETSLIFTYALVLSKFCKVPSGSLSVCPGLSDRDHPDDRMERHLLLRLRQCQLRLPDG